MYINSDLLPYKEMFIIIGLFRYPTLNKSKET